MVVYQQKRAEKLTLQSEVERLQKENDQYVDRIKALKTDHRALKERRANSCTIHGRASMSMCAGSAVQPPIGRAKNEK